MIIIIIIWIKERKKHFSNMIVPENAAESSIKSESSIKDTQGFSFALIGFNNLDFTLAPSPFKPKLLRLRSNPTALIPRNFINPNFSDADGPHSTFWNNPEQHGGRSDCTVVISARRRRILGVKSKLWKRVGERRVRNSDENWEWGIKLCNSFQLIHSISNCDWLRHYIIYKKNG